MIWTKEADELLIKLWDDGGSLHHVADGMTAAGYAVTRNAIAGRRHRLSRDGEVFKRSGQPPVRIKLTRRRSLYQPDTEKTHGKLGTTHPH